MWGPQKDVYVLYSLYGDCISSRGLSNGFFDFVGPADLGGPSNLSGLTLFDGLFVALTIRLGGCLCF